MDSRKNIVMSPEYDVFICHRGPDTKHNVVSVLRGMLRCIGITCFVDYQMDMGIDVKSGISAAIQNSKVFIIIMSPQFASSTWCLEEVVQIISNPDPKVIPVFYDVHQNKPYDLSQHKGRNDGKIDNWCKVLEVACSFDGFDYNNEDTLQWERLVEIVARVGYFLKLPNIISNPGAKMPSSGNCVDYDVFICHWRPDTQRNVVSVLRGMLLSRGSIPFVVGYGSEEGERQLDSEIINAIENSRVHVIILSPGFGSCKRCLQEVVHIMNIQNSPCTSDTRRKPKVLPIFYNVRPSDVRYQGSKTAFYLNKVERSTDEDRKSWAVALKGLSMFKGLEYETGKTFQWERLCDIVKLTKGSATEVMNDGSECETLYKEEINEVLKELESQDAVEDVLLVGIYGYQKTNFSYLLVETVGRNFDRIYRLTNVMKKVCPQDGVSRIIQEMCSNLIQVQPGTSNDARNELLFEK
ncbi:hypothetical protein KP509_08G007200 [Ceratopteris richardii]|uniref:ADP-ribosyl cyclase/cyclic ADP-ribose hydrolase n=1 Tax=Ceratopteris richardii TaxID=49495 RepID=A0A8T2U7H2_CERRI|nr:hypothetical protein KP509_08G007200 [Ceratopteris richardii]